MGARLIFTALYEPFLAQIKVAFYTALFFAFPVISIQVWMFVAPGLYRNEKRAFLPFLFATPILFFMGGALVSSNHAASLGLLSDLPDTWR